MWTEILTSVACILICTRLLMGIIIGRIKDQSKYLCKVPGPKPIFPFGNVLDVIEGSIVFLPKMREYFGIFGDTFVVHDGPFSWAVLTIDYELTDLILSSTDLTEKAVQYEYFDGWLGKGLLTSAGSHWRSHRKVITPSFHFSILQEFIAVFNRMGKKLAQKLGKEVAKDNVDISKLVSLCTLDIISEAAMGVKINAMKNENSEYIKSIKTMCTIVAYRTVSFLSSKIYPFTLDYFREQRALKVIHEFVDGVISKRIEDNKQQEKGSKMEDDVGTKKRLAFLDMLLEARIDEKPLTRRELRDEVNTFMFEGHDTTSSAINFSLYLLANHPEVQEKVFNEQKAIFGDDLKDVTPTYKNLNEMKYLDLVIKETLRLYPSVPFIGRRLLRDLEFKGSVYPKGLNILIASYVYQRNPEHFPEPDKFIPKRFENFTTKFPFTYTPFSAGQRNCIGQKFAVLEMLSTISEVIRNFELKPAKPEHKLQLAAETILISKNGVNISLRSR